MKTQITSQLCELPLLQYAFINPETISFSEKVRSICETECAMYAKSWSCPPAVGTVDELKQRVHKYKNGLLFTTISENTDTADFSAMIKSVKTHTRTLSSVHAILKQYYNETLMLSSEACANCKECTYPHDVCRHPEIMYPCIESYGILVTELAENNSISLSAYPNTVIWVGLALYK